MPLYGYARVSSLDQDLTLQEETLRAAGCHVVRAEKRSGAGREGRSELRLLLDFLHAGDTLVVTRIDRLARSVKDLQDIVHAAKAKGVYKGRKPSIDPAEVRRLREAEGLGPSAIARRLGIGRTSVYRVLGIGSGAAPASRNG